MKCFAKLLAASLALLLLLPGLASCHGAGATYPFQMPEAFDTEGTYEITFWAKNDTNMTQMNIYREAIASFEALYPNIKVNLRPYTDYARIYNDVITNIATGTTPNVCITYPDHIATYLTGANTVVPLDELSTDAKYGFGGSELRYDAPTQEQIIERYLGEGSFDGRLYAIPFMRSTEACYVNRTYVEALGFTLPETLTWDFVWEVSEAALAKDSEGNFAVNGQKVLIPFIYKSTDNMMIQYLKQSGGEYSTAEGDILLFNDTTEEFLLEVAEHAESGAFSTFKISSYPANFLNAGQCIFAVDSTAGATWMGPEAPLMDIAEEAVVDFDIEVMTIPQCDPKAPTMISQGPSICIFNKEDPQEVLASWLFAQYLLTDGVQIAYARTEGYAPVTHKARENEEYIRYLSTENSEDDLYYHVKLKATRLLLENTDNTFVTPVFNGSASLRDAAGQLVEYATKNVQRGKVVDATTLPDIYRDISALYRLDGMRSVAVGGESMGPLPKEAVILLGSLGVTWFGMAFYLLARWAKKIKQKNGKK